MQPADSQVGVRKPDLGVQIRWVAGVLLQRRRLVAWFAIVGALLAGIAAVAVPPSYTASAQILVLPEQGSGESDEAAVDTQITILNSDAHLRRVLDSLRDTPGVAPGAVEPAGQPAVISRIRTALGDAVGRLKRTLLPTEGPGNSVQLQGAGEGGTAALKQALNITQERRSRIVAVRYTDRNPDRAAAVANRIVQLHVERLRDAKRADAEGQAAWFERQIASSRAELAEAEAELRSYVSVHGTKRADGSDLELIAERRRQLGLVRAGIAENQAKLDRVRELRGQGADEAAMQALVGSPAPDDINGQSKVPTGAQPSDRNGASGAPPNATARGEPDPQVSEVRPQVDRDILRLGRQTQVLQAQAQSIEKDLTFLQDAASRDADEATVRADLERRVASSAKQLDDLRRRQQETANQNELASLPARLLAPAPRPTRPNSINPTLIATGALIAFAMLGSAVAITLDRLDRTLRSESDVADALGIPCIGVIPAFRAGHKTRQDRQLLAEYDLRCRSIVVSALRLAAPQRAPRVLLVASSMPEEGKTTLATSIGLRAARLGRRVLFVDFSIRPNKKPDRGGSDDNQSCFRAGVLERVLEGDLSDAIRILPELGFDYLAARRIGIDLPLLCSDQRALKVLRDVREDYDCVIIDSAAILASEEARLLATIADEVVFAVQWGSTTREIARHAFELLRESAGIATGTPARIGAVLTRVDFGRTAHNRDLPEFAPRAGGRATRGYSKLSGWSADAALSPMRLAASVGHAAFQRAGEVLASGARIMPKIRPAARGTEASSVDWRASTRSCADQRSAGPSRDPRRS